MRAEIHHIAFLTGRPQEMIDFYTRSLGFTTLETKTIPQSLMSALFGLDAPGWATKLTRGGILLEMISADGPDSAAPSVSGTGINHWALGVSDKEGFVDDLKGRGMEVLELSKGEKTVVFLRDPDGNLIEVYQLQAAP